jgi:hypothetical protein
MRKKTSSDHVYEEPVSTEEETFPLRPGAESPPLLAAFRALSANDVYTMAPKDVVPEATTITSGSGFNSIGGAGIEPR